MWAGDITFVALAGGRWCYLSVWMDLYSRRIIGWHLDDNIRETLITKAFQKATTTRKIPGGLIVHSNRGDQYAGTVFRKLLDKKKLLQSMSRADNP